MPGSMAAAAGVLPGDVVTSIAGAPVTDASALRAALRADGADVVIEYARAGAARRATVSAIRVGEERLDGGRVEYGAIASGGVRLRTIATIPAGAGPHPVVVFLQGIACASIDFAGTAVPPVGALLHELTRLGLATLRLERRGLGDSEGGPCEVLDFETELADLRAALAEVDPTRLVLFGHSIGGMMLPLLADSSPPRAAIVFGTSSVRWSDCMAASTRRQLALRGTEPEAIDREVAAEAEAIARAAPDEILFGRSGAFHGQLQNARIEEAYGRLRCPLLVVQGEHDWVVGEDESRALAARPGAELFVAPGMDHAFGCHPSRAASLEHFGKGTFDPALAARIEEFVRRST